MPMLDATQLTDYLIRIGVPTPAAPTLTTLDKIIAAQLARIPFENVDVLLHRPVDIRLDAVFDKLVARGRGGYCFEQNTLLAAALRALGFTVTPLAARVRLGVAPDVQTSLSHMLLRVEAEHRSYLADVGFGGPNPPHALALPPPVSPARGVPDPTFRLLPAPELADLPDDDLAAHRTAFHVYDLQLRTPTGWLTLYRFDLAPQPWIDFVARNWFVSTHPDSFFLRTLTAARTERGARLSLVNRAFTVREPDGSVRQQTLATAAQTVDMLRDRFSLDLDADTRAGLETVLGRLG